MNVSAALNELGFHDDSIRRFQLAYCGPPVGANTGGWLGTDGVAGPKTQDSLQWVMSNGGKLSTHFTVHEVACRHCGCPYVRRELLSALEALRDQVDHPIYLLDAYRCPQHNAAEGGARDSMHLWGAAADLDIGRTRITTVQATNCQRFSGIGNRGVLASHIDVRHLIPEHNLTKSATPASPARWSY